MKQFHNARKLVLRMGILIVLIIQFVATFGAGLPRAAAAQKNRLHLAALRVQVLNQINAIRRDFGLARALPTNAYSTAVIKGAVANTDPPLAWGSTSVLREYSVWGLDETAAPTSLEPMMNNIVNTWVYRDGWLNGSTSNLECTSPNAPSCSAHRRAILSLPPRRGAHLYIDVAVNATAQNSEQRLSISALLVWK